MVKSDDGRMDKENVAYVKCNLIQHEKEANPDICNSINELDFTHILSEITERNTV